MSDNFKNQRRSSADKPERSRPRHGSEWARMEEIGDLHFYASSYSTALDY